MSHAIHRTSSLRQSLGHLRSLRQAWGTAANISDQHAETKPHRHHFGLNSVDGLLLEAAFAIQLLARACAGLDSVPRRRLVRHRDPRKSQAFNAFRCRKLFEAEQQTMPPGLVALGRQSSGDDCQLDKPIGLNVVTGARGLDGLQHRCVEHVSCRLGVLRILPLILSSG